MPDLEVYISSKLSIKNPNILSPIATNRLLDLLTKVNPEVAMRKKLGLYPPEEKVLKLYSFAIYRQNDIVATSLEIDRGCWKELAIVPKVQPDIRIKFIDKRVKAPIEPFPKFQGVLDKFQEDALAKIGSQSQGTLILPTGGGKTVIALKLLANLKQRALIFVHTHKLLNQWKDRISQYLPGAKVATLPGTTAVDLEQTLRDSHIVIATIQTMYSLISLKSAMSGKNTLEAGKAMLKKSFCSLFGVVLLDECHHAPANTFRRVMNFFPSYYRYGLTATRERRDGKTFYVDSVFGPPIVELGYKNVGNRIITPIIYPIRTELSENYFNIYRDRRGQQVIDYVSVYNKFAIDVARNIVILQLIKDHLTQFPEALILVLSKRREHAKFLRELLLSHKIPTEVMLGGVQSKKQRLKEIETLKEAENGRLRVLVGTSVADEGLDIPRLDTLILGFPTSWSGITAQRIGRIIRNFSGKAMPVVYDLIDADIPEIFGSWWARKRFYIVEGFEINYSLYAGIEKI